MKRKRASPNNDIQITSTRDITLARLNEAIAKEIESKALLTEELICHVPKDVGMMILVYVTDPEIPHVYLPRGSWIIEGKIFFFNWTRWYTSSTSPSPPRKQRATNSKGKKDKWSISTRDFLKLTHRHFADEGGRWKSDMEISFIVANTNFDGNRIVMASAHRHDD